MWYHSGYLSFSIHIPIIASIYGLNLSVFILMINSWYWANYSHIILCIFISSSWNKFIERSSILSNTAIISNYSPVSCTSTFVAFFSSLTTCFVLVFFMICLYICLNYFYLVSVSSDHSLISLLMNSESTKSNSSSWSLSSSSEYPSWTPSSSFC
jgi:hypothetical protein